MRSKPQGGPKLQAPDSSGLFALVVRVGIARAAPSRLMVCPSQRPDRLIGAVPWLHRPWSPYRPPPTRAARARSGDAARGDPGLGYHEKHGRRDRDPSVSGARHAMRRSRAMNLGGGARTHCARGNPISAPAPGIQAGVVRLHAQGSSFQAYTLYYSQNRYRCDPYPLYPLAYTPNAHGWNAERREHFIRRPSPSACEAPPAERASAPDQWPSAQGDEHARDASYS